MNIKRKKKMSKNILKENMRRFNTKNLKEQTQMAMYVSDLDEAQGMWKYLPPRAKEEWKRLENEQVNQDGVAYFPPAAPGDEITDLLNGREIVSSLTEGQENLLGMFHALFPLLKKGIRIDLSDIAALDKSIKGLR